MDIHIFDNFLSPDELSEALNIVNNLSWTFGQTSNENRVECKFWISYLTDYSFFTEKVFNKITEITNKNFKIVRVYANGQTYGLDGSYHIDDDKDNTYTFLIYLSDINSNNVNRCGGYTLFKQNDDVKCVEPLMNRAVLFKSNILHCGQAPTRMTNFLRITAAFKLEEC